MSACACFEAASTVRPTLIFFLRPAAQLAPLPSQEQLPHSRRQAHQFGCLNHVPRTVSRCGIETKCGLRSPRPPLPTEPKSRNADRRRPHSDAPLERTLSRGRRPRLRRRSVSGRLSRAECDHPIATTVYAKSLSGGSSATSADGVAVAAYRPGREDETHADENGRRLRGMRARICDLLLPASGADEVARGGQDSAGRSASFKSSGKTA